MVDDTVKGVLKNIQLGIRIFDNWHYNNNKILFYFILAIALTCKYMFLFIQIYKY